MIKKLSISITIFFLLFLVDQYIKFIFVNGFEAHSKCISLILAYNKGVAFSMFAFLDGNLKYIQIALLSAGAIYLYFNKEVFSTYYIPIALLGAGGISNIFDRFIHEGVVDYIYWHCWFDFAIFNISDIYINIGVLFILIKSWRDSKKENS